MIRLDNKVVMITGGTGGLGQPVTRGVFKLGCNRGHGGTSVSQKIYPTV